jgi:hypothetical protein
MHPRSAPSTHDHADRASPYVGRPSSQIPAEAATDPSQLPRPATTARPWETGEESTAVHTTSLPWIDAACVRDSQANPMTLVNPGANVKVAESRRVPCST